jgi:hypothetical protein
MARQAPKKALSRNAANELGAQSSGEEPPSHPEIDSRDELERIRRRNLELLSGAKPSTEGERSIAGIRTEHSGPPHSGDYSND